MISTSASGIDPVRPGQNPASQVVDFLESGLLQEIHGLGAAHAGAAMRHDLFAGIQFADPLRKIAQRNQVSVDVADLIFVRLADVEDEKIVASIQAPL